MDKFSPDQFAEVFVLSEEKHERTEDREPLTIWITAEYKARYDLLQARSRHKFGKFLKEVIKKSIDKVIDNKNAA